MEKGGIIKRYSQRISRILLVSLCIGLIIYFMPKGKSVYYDFKPETPWAHEQLRAEFDFEIPKTSIEMQAEEDSIRQLSIPIFQQFETSDELYNAFLGKSFKSNTSITGKGVFLDSLRAMLNNGIIEDKDTLYLNKSHNKILTYRKGSDRRRLESRDFITLSQARERLRRTVVDTAGIMSIIKPNYKYDTEASGSELEKQIKAIDPVYKYIKEG